MLLLMLQVQLYIALSLFVQDGSDCELLALPQGM